MTRFTPTAFRRLVLASALGLAVLLAAGVAIRGDRGRERRDARARPGLEGRGARGR